MAKEDNLPHTKFRRLERVLKGVANHRRLQMIDLLQREPELSVSDIADRLRLGYENTSDHLRRLAIAGLILKRYQGNVVRHKLTDQARMILVFCKKLE